MMKKSLIVALLFCFILCTHGFTLRINPDCVIDRCKIYGNLDDAEGCDIEYFPAILKTESASCQIIKSDGSSLTCRTFGSSHNYQECVIFYKITRPPPVPPTLTFAQVAAHTSKQTSDEQPSSSQIFSSQTSDSPINISDGGTSQIGSQTTSTQNPLKNLAFFSYIIGGTSQVGSQSSNPNTSIQLSSDPHPSQDSDEYYSVVPSQSFQ